MESAYGLNIPQTLEDVCDPTRMALVIYDMQVGIISQLPDAAPVVARVGQALEAARVGGFRVFFTRHLFLPKKAAGVFALRQAMSWQRVTSVEQVQPWIQRDSPEFQIVPELAPLPDEVIIDKITMSAFEGTFLNFALRDCGVNAYAIAGIALEIGIGPTVQHSTDLGYIPVVVTDACGGRDEAAMERVLTDMRFAGDALLTDTAAFCACLQHKETR